MPGKPLTSITTGLLVTSLNLLACSWDYPVWPKSKQSDTPLFRFTGPGKYSAGYIDRQGRIAIPPQFFISGNHGGDFFSGLAMVGTEDSDFYIDPSGNRMAPIRGYSVGDFSEGFAVATSRSERKTGFIDRTGKLSIPAIFQDARSFSEGLAVVKFQGSYGYIDQQGKFAIPPRFAYATGFSDGHAFVIENGTCQLFDDDRCSLSPRVVLTVFVGIKPNGSVTPQPCRYSIIDKTGAVVSGAKYIYAKPFSEGLALVWDGKRWGYVDYSGKVRIPLQFEDAEPFSEGLASVRRDGRYGFIDKTGKMVIEPQYNRAWKFSEGLAVVIDGSHKYRFIDMSGKQAIAGEFDGASNFAMGLAHVRVGTGKVPAKWSYIDRTGRVIFTYSNQSPDSADRL